MDPERFLGHEVYKTRVEWLRELADSLERAYAAVVESDLSQISRQTAHQQELCARLRQHATEFVGTPVSGSPRGLPPPANDVNYALREELAELATKVAQLNRRYEALLRRARRTVDIFCRVLANAAATYPPPPEAVSFAAVSGVSDVQSL